ncbi:MAG: hypothetical protein WCB99_10925 [Candidatus Cybelea sp.]|jgi:hypothetical protein
MSSKRPLLSVAMLSLVAGLPAVTSAYTVTTPHPVTVSTCNPQRNIYRAAGYTPGFYPGWAGPYWGWGSVYGPMYYQYPTQGNPTLSIDYVNATNTVMKQIEFGLIVHGNLVAEVKDVGTFSPGAEIKHQFGLNPNVFPLQTSYAQCVPLKIAFEDGTHWKNPHLPALRRSIYGKPSY